MTWIYSYLWIKEIVSVSHTKSASKLSYNQKKPTADSQK